MVLDSNGTDCNKGIRPLLLRMFSSDFFFILNVSDTDGLCKKVLQYCNGGIPTGCLRWRVETLASVMALLLAYNLSKWQNALKYDLR